MIAIVISVVLGLLVNECCDLSPWCADKLVRWSAYRRYTDPMRAAVRAEELAALIKNRPGKLLKLFSALGFAGCAVIVACKRELARRQAAKARSEQVSSQDKPTLLVTVLMWVAVFIIPKRDRPLYGEAWKADLDYVLTGQAARSPTNSLSPPGCSWLACGCA
jgi:hypothetical protein